MTVDRRDHSLILPKYPLRHQRAGMGVERLGILSGKIIQSDGRKLAKFQSPLLDGNIEVLSLFAQNTSIDGLALVEKHI